MKKYNLLIVDDEPGILMTLEDLLTGHGFMVKSISDGAEAVSAIKKESFDLIITDMKMPGLDGGNLLQQAKDFDPNIEVIIFTGYANVADAVLTLKGNGASDYITKPLEDNNRLISAVNQALKSQSLKIENKRLIRELQIQTKSLLEANQKLKLEIEERKLIEEERFKLQAKLNRTKQMEALGMLAGSVAHDLNNILSGIISYPQLILMNDTLSDKLKKSIQTIQNAGEKAAAVVDDLLTLAKGVAKYQSVLNLNTVLEDFLGSPLLQKYKRVNPYLQIQMSKGNELKSIYASAYHIRKTLMKLIINASEAVDQKGTILISTKNKKVESTIHGFEDIEPGDYVTLTISDNGPGLQSTDLERIFEPFFTKKVLGRSGTGIGLALVLNTVQDHSGFVDIHGNKNGTTFELYFPVTHFTKTKNTKITAKNSYFGNGELILVVDDENLQREIAHDFLKQLNYRVATVSGGKEAITFLKNNSVELVLLDMVMSTGMDGLETYQKIIEQNPKQKALIVSGYAQTENVKHMQNLGAGELIKKPYSLEKIGIAIKQELCK